MLVVCFFVLSVGLALHASDTRSQVTTREVLVNRTSYGDVASLCQTVLKRCDAGSSLLDAAENLQNATCVRDSEIGEYLDNTRTGNAVAS